MLGGELPCGSLAPAVHLFLFRHVAHDAARVNEFTISPVRARVDQDFPDRSVLAAQPRRIIAERFVAFETDEDVVARRAVRMKVPDVAADVFVARVAEQIQLRRVRPEDRPIGVDPMHAVDRVFDEIPELLFGLAQFRVDGFTLRENASECRLELAPVFNLGLERACVVLEQCTGDPLAIRRPGIRQGRRGGDVGVGPADVVQRWPRVADIEERSNRVRAKQRKRMSAGEPVPLFFEADRRRPAFLFPQQVHHLAVSAERGAVLSLQPLLDESAESRFEAILVRHAVDHELRQRLFRVHQQQLACIPRCIDVEASRRDVANERVLVLRRGDDNDRLAACEALDEKPADERQQRRVVLIEMHVVVRTRRNRVRSCSFGGRA